MDMNLIMRFERQIADAIIEFILNSL